VTHLEGSRFRARLSDKSGTVVDVDANVNIDQNTGSVSGTVTGRPTR